MLVWELEMANIYSGKVKLTFIVLTERVSCIADFPQVGLGHISNGGFAGYIFTAFGQISGKRLIGKHSSFIKCLKSKYKN